MKSEEGRKKIEPKGLDSMNRKELLDLLYEMDAFIHLYTTRREEILKELLKREGYPPTKEGKTRG